MTLSAIYMERYFDGFPGAILDITRPIITCLELRELVIYNRPFKWNVNCELFSFSTHNKARSYSVFWQLRGVRRALFQGRKMRHVNLVNLLSRCRELVNLNNFTNIMFTNGSLCFLYIVLSLLIFTVFLDNVSDLRFKWLEEPGVDNTGALGCQPRRTHQQVRTENDIAAAEPSC